MQTKITQELAEFIRSKVSKDKEITFNNVREICRIDCSLQTEEPNSLCIIKKCEGCTGIYERTNHKCNIFKRELEDIIREYDAELLKNISIGKAHKFTNGDPTKLIALEIKEK